MHRPALARLYRPRRFSEIVGQEHVSTTLPQAVERGRVAHAYLFCGPRGVGKTTAARVLAMALNCRDRSDGEPCGKCESCERIWSGRTSLDVVEIDAASNRGVDDARELRERAMYAPSEESRYKVYIIDEAHMLTREAWNAFLKILEEPPPRVIFVLATTEPGKILQTAPPILSRCQRFDFHRISIDRILARLRQVLEAEGIGVHDAALVPIARKADGALRDALSALDQVLAFSGEELTADDVRRVLGLVDEDLYFELFEIVADHRAADVFGYVDRLVEGGYDFEEFYRGLAQALRILLRLKLGGTSDEAPAAGAISERYGELAGRFEPGDLMRMLSALAELDTDGRFRKSEQQRLLIEILLLRFALMDRTVELEQLIEAAGVTVAPRAPEPSGGNPDPVMQRRPRDPVPETRAEPEERPGTEGPAPKAGSTPLDAAREAWQGMIADAKTLRPGQGIALRGARLIEFGEDGELRVLVTADSPGAELLDDMVTRRRLEEELSRRLGRPIQVTSVLEDNDPPPDLDERAVRKERLRELTGDDSELRELVDKLDLEVID